MTELERLARELPRLGYDSDEGIWFDRTKPCGPGVDDNGHYPLYEECDPIEVCAALEAERNALRRDFRALNINNDEIEDQNERLLDRIARAKAILQKNGRQGALREAVIASLAEPSGKSEETKEA